MGWRIEREFTLSRSYTIVLVSDQVLAVCKNTLCVISRFPPTLSSAPTLPIRNLNMKLFSPHFTRLLVAVVLLGVASAMAQPTKRPIAHTDFDAWRTIATPVLSSDGKWLAYSVQPQDGDGELIVREIASGKERRESVGLLPPPMIAPNEQTTLGHFLGFLACFACGNGVSL